MFSTYYLLCNVVTFMRNNRVLASELTSRVGNASAYTQQTITIQKQVHAEEGEKLRNVAFDASVKCQFPVRSVDVE